MNIQILTEDTQHPVVITLQNFITKWGYTVCTYPLKFVGGCGIFYYKDIPSSMDAVALAAVITNQTRMEKIPISYEEWFSTLDTHTKDRVLYLVYRDTNDARISVVLETKYLGSIAAKELTYRTSIDGFRTSDSNWDKGLNLL